MAHSIKGMAASLGYDSITELAHKLEDRMQLVREAGAIDPREELSVLFRGLAALEAMVGAVRESGDAPPADLDLVEALAAHPASLAQRGEAERRPAASFAERGEAERRPAGPPAPKKKRAEPADARRATPAPAARLEAPRPPPLARSAWSRPIAGASHGTGSRSRRSCSRARGSSSASAS